ncbi:MAG: hypothetical protein QOK42_1945 [Frankiaceae bacterium]|nr:hypothetical protein [Frankiaceae bacterium]
MTTPNDPNQPPGYGQPASGDPAGGYGAPGYGAPAGGVPAPMGGMPELAGWGIRVGGALLDMLVLIGVLAGAIILGLLLGAASDVLGAIVITLGIIGGVIFAFWNACWRLGKTGQSLGKKWVGISVRRESDGSVLGAGGGFARYFIHYFSDGLCFLGYLWPLWDEKKQTWTDKIQSTVVVKV